MTEKLKYKVGDKVLIEAEVMGVLEGDDSPYRIHINGCYRWLDREFVEQNDLNLPPKPKISQAVMEYYTQNKSEDYDYDEWFERSGMPDGIESWLYHDGDDDILMRRQHALATLIAYGPEAVEVEKEKKYEVRIKNDVVFSRNLVYDSQVRTFEFSAVRDRDAYQFTKQELIEAGFEGVFDNPMFEVEEVE